MPLGKYYCDYCEKQFQDTLSARKRHLEGAQHQRAKALWYASFRSGGLDAAGAGAVGGALPPRGVCHHFVRTGFCQFGDGCRYFHPKQNAANEHQMTPAGPNSAVMTCAPSSMGSQHFVGSSVLGKLLLLSLLNLILMILLGFLGATYLPHLDHHQKAVIYLSLLLSGIAPSDIIQAHGNFLRDQALGSFFGQLYLHTLFSRLVMDYVSFFSTITDARMKLYSLCE
ncbi:hypothetical protein Taro_045442 [Colocasia esculenta]|uniref:C3H1-type domain-containing protein n=1 Tax=Colocasia esculenta TaxID=4460 RepID=A0A843X2S5_COLES|nr:hypothetical protein [Colocasia esculenta]